MKVRKWFRFRGGMLGSDLTQDVNQALCHYSQCQCPGVNLLTQSWIKPNNFQGGGKWRMMVKWDKTVNEIMYGSITHCWKKRSSFYLLKMELLWIFAAKGGEGDGMALCIYFSNELKYTTTISSRKPSKIPWGKKYKFCLSRNLPVVERAGSKV